MIEFEINSNFIFFDCEAYKIRDGYAQSIMDIKTGKVYGLCDKTGRIEYLSTQDNTLAQKVWADDDRTLLKGCILMGFASILNFDGLHGDFQY